MERNKVFNFDGEIVIITNFKSLLETFSDEELEYILKTNMYYHELNLELNELVDLGYIKEVNGLRYEPAEYLMTIDTIKEFVANELGPDTVNRWISEIDYDFKKNKPKK